MAQRRMTATHISMGVWRFECLAHEQPYKFQEISNPKQAIQAMKAHCNNDHPGKLMSLTRESQHSGTSHIMYRAPDADMQARE
jgi:hypothetical protein